MARYKVKGKDCQLKVKVKLSFKEEIDERQLDFFSSKLGNCETRDARSQT